MKTKVVSLAGAAKFIKDGNTITTGGFALSQSPMAFIHQIIRKALKI